ncbi:MAG: transketolase C-terminal domain-containing protein, partial [Pseudomonadota bacterium]|nr:transketolase C-terminal domain-containing protein [Pseudomonadota bacterium]
RSEHFIAQIDAYTATSEFCKVSCHGACGHWDSDVKREGTDLTVVATMTIVPRALLAARRLERDGISVEVVDLRTLKPLDEETILNSVMKTNRVLIVHEAWTTGGFGAEVASVIADKGFDWLDAPVKRLGAMDTPMPYNKELEHATIPSTDKIAETIRELMQYKEA